MIPRSHGIQIKDMNNVMYYMNYDMCYVYDVVCCVKNIKFDGACYSHGINFIIQIWKAHKLPSPNLESSLTFLIAIWQVH